MLANDPVTQARIDLTTALRAAVRHGLNEGVCNHFSMTVPGREELFGNIGTVGAPGMPGNPGQ